MVINENEFPSLVRQTSTTSTSIGNGHISRTPFNPNAGIITPGTPTAAAIVQSNIPSYSSKDASGSMAGLRNLYSIMQAPTYLAGPGNEFNLQNDREFPALSSTNSQNSQNMNSILSNEKDDAKKTPGSQRGIQTHQNGRITNIPPGMVNDQYGMAGILAFIKSVDKSPNLLELAIGHDLTNLGLNLGSPDRNLYQSFGGPFSDSAVRTQDIECNVPEEYRTSALVKDRLPPIKLGKLSDDTLFWLFYNCPGEAYQMAAAHELYNRDWRYHKIMSVWLTRSAYGNIKEQTSNYEKGSYNVFDPIQWRKIPKEMQLEYKDLEAKPTQLSTEFNKPGAGNGSGATSSLVQSQKIISNLATLNLGAGSTPSGVPQTPNGGSGTVGKPLI
jgi:hypothetical protein